MSVKLRVAHYHVYVKSVRDTSKRWNTVDMVLICMWLIGFAIIF